MHQKDIGASHGPLEQKLKKLLIIKASGEPLYDITLLYKHMKDMVSRNLKE
jgi:hypothetical protein